MRVLSAEAATTKGLAIASRGIFAELSPEQLQGLQAEGEFRTYANEVVAADAQPLDTLFHILRGEFEVSKADPETGFKVTLAKLGPEQAFGEMSFLSGTPASANVLAKGRVVCWTVSPRAPPAVCGRDQPGRGPRLAMNLATLLADRVREGNTRLVGMSSTLERLLRARRAPLQGNERAGCPGQPNTPTWRSPPGSSTPSPARPSIWAAMSRSRTPRGNPSARGSPTTTST